MRPVGLVNEKRNNFWKRGNDKRWSIRGEVRAGKRKVADENDRLQHATGMLYASELGRDFPQPDRLRPDYRQQACPKEGFETRSGTIEFDQQRVLRFRETVEAVRPG